MYWPWDDPFGPKHAVNRSHIYIINTPCVWQDGIFLYLYHRHNGMNTFKPNSSVAFSWNSIQAHFFTHRYRACVIFVKIGSVASYFTSALAISKPQEGYIIREELVWGPHICVCVYMCIYIYIYISHCWLFVSFVKSCENKALIFWAHAKLHSHAYHATLWRVESKERLGKVYALRHGVQHLLSSCI